MGIRTRLLVALLPIILLSIGGLTLDTVRQSKKTVVNEITRDAFNLAQASARDLDLLIATSQKIADGVAAAAEEMPVMHPNACRGLLERVFRANPEVYGMAIALEPTATGLGAFGPYVHRTGDGVVWTDLATPAYDYTRWEWYRAALDRGEGIWSKPYFDEGGGDILMVTYSSPIRRDGKTIGVATVDISLQTLVDRLRKLEVGRTGYACLMRDDGTFIAHPQGAMLVQDTIIKDAPQKQRDALAALKELVTLHGHSYREMVDPFSGKLSWIMETPVTSTLEHAQERAWSIIISYPTDELLAPLASLQLRIAAAAIAIVGLLIAVIARLSLSVTRPLTQLMHQATCYAEGDFAHRIDDTVGMLEVRGLSQAFNRLGTAIVEQMDVVRRTTEQKERYRQELAIAADIQQGILPKSFERIISPQDAVDLFACMYPAKEVGGDFYDVIPLPEHKLGIVVADVSDKGAPAALFMAMSCMLVRILAQRGLPPAEILRRANHVLAQDNPSSMFVTLFLGLLDTRTGRLVYASAGHPSALLRQVDGTVRTLPVSPGLPLGALNGSRYAAASCCIEASEVLVLYTDGVTEALNNSQEEFGSERLREALLPPGVLSSKTITDAILDAIHRFSDTADVADDITLLVLRRLQPSPGVASMPPPRASITLTLERNTVVLSKLALVLDAIGREAGFDDKQIYDLSLAVDEIVTNVILHGTQPDQVFSVEITPLADGVQVVVIDNDPPFDFEDAVGRYRGKASKEQPVGGIGLYLAHEFVDVLEYEPGAVDGNRTKIVKRRPTVA